MRGGLITSFYIYISHVKSFTSNINEEGAGLRNFVLVAYFNFCDLKWFLILFFVI